MSDRLKVAWEQILTALLPSLATYVKWEFRVQSSLPGPPVTISAAAVSADCPWQTLANITLWPGPSGAYAIPAPGTLVLVEFHEGNPGKPSIAGLDPNNVPILTTLGGGSTPIAREGDTITITQAQFVAAGAVANLTSGNVAIASLLQGTITSGSSKVVSG